MRTFAFLVVLAIGFGCLAQQYSFWAALGVCYAGCMFLVVVIAFLRGRSDPQSFKREEDSA